MTDGTPRPRPPGHLPPGPQSLFERVAPAPLLLAWLYGTLAGAGGAAGAAPGFEKSTTGASRLAGFVTSK